MLLMAVNADKTKVMIVTNYQKEAKLSSSVINVNFNDTLLENVNAEKLLGVVIDKHLSWKDLFKRQTDVSTRVTRFNLSYNGPVEFNQVSCDTQELSCDTQECPSLKSFKCKDFKHFMQSV